MLTPATNQSPTTDARQTLLDSLGVDLRREFGDAEKYRIEQERVWLDDLRQYKGIYTPEEISRMGKRSKAFIRLSRSKIKSLDARMQDMLFPAGTNKNWSLTITPVPEIDPNTLPPDMIEAIKAASPHCQLISERMQEKIRAKYPLEDELAYARIGIGAAHKLYAPTQEEFANIAAFGVFVEGVRQWGRDERAKLGL